MSLAGARVAAAALLIAAGAATVGRALAASDDAKSALGFSFREVAREAGLDAVTVFGGKDVNRYLLETTGCGAAFLDYDGDGWLDVFLVNGTTLEGFPRGQEPINHLYRNRGDGTFEDVTRKAGLAQSGWGQGVCAGDYDNDGNVDLFVTYYGQNHLYRNKGDGTFEDVTAKAGLLSKRLRWNTGCAFLDYDRDGKLDLLVANYIDLDLATAPTPDSGLCRYKGVKVACGPPGLPGGRNALTDVAVPAGCAYSQDGKPQAGMGVAVGDYDRNGTMDVFKTNFAGDTSTLYANTGQGFCEDRTFASGIGLNTRWLGWGTAFVDFAKDGWLDLFLVNGHVYPEVVQLKTEAGYRQRKVVYRNAGGRFEDVSERLGPPVTDAKAGRGAAFGDYDNDGDVDVVINNVNDRPDLYRTESDPSRHWLLLKLVGTQSNRSAIGARVRCLAGGVTQVQEVRGGGSYMSQNDLRVHFGLAATATVDRLQVRWPNGREEEWTGIAADRIVTLTEGTGKGL